MSPDITESFWSTLKSEFYDRRKWATRAEARAGVADWIERVYNRRRLHSSIEYVTQVAFEREFVIESQLLLAA